MQLCPCRMSWLAIVTIEGRGWIHHCCKMINSIEETDLRRIDKQPGPPCVAVTIQWLFSLANPESTDRQSTGACSQQFSFLVMHTKTDWLTDWLTNSAGCCCLERKENRISSLAVTLSTTFTTPCTSIRPSVRPSNLVAAAASLHLLILFLHRSERDRSSTMPFIYVCWYVYKCCIVSCVWLKQRRRRGARSNQRYHIQAETSLLFLFFLFYLFFHRTLPVHAHGFTLRV